jgi:membrane dipeptidase
MQKFTAIHRMAEQMYPNLIEIAYTPADAERIDKAGKLVAAIGIENGWVIGHDLSLIQKYYDLGARYMTLAHTQNNDICDSSTDPRGAEWHGLSPFGSQVVAEMNRVGMMVDVSHVSRECMMQATALSTSPVIGSHSSTTAVANVAAQHGRRDAPRAREERRRGADGGARRLRQSADPGA